MQRTRDAASEDQPLRQWTPLVRAAIKQRMNGARAGAEQGHVEAALACDTASPELRDLSNATNGNPLGHDSGLFCNGGCREGGCDGFELALVHACLVELEPRVGLSIQCVLQLGP